MRDIAFVSVSSISNRTKVVTKLEKKSGNDGRWLDSGTSGRVRAGEREVKRANTSNFHNRSVKPWPCVYNGRWEL